MKKILKNKKGFTLIELLAVIVVLTIIMVIATQQINGTIKKNRADSFVSSYKTILNSLELCEAQNMKAADCKNTVKLSDEDYTLILEDTSNGYNLTLTAKTGGQFQNMNLTAYYQEQNGNEENKSKLKNATTVSDISIMATYKFTS